MVLRQPDRGKVLEVLPDLVDPAKDLVELPVGQNEVVGRVGVAYSFLAEVQVREVHVVVHLPWAVRQDVEVVLHQVD